MEFPVSYTFSHYLHLKGGKKTNYVLLYRIARPVGSKAVYAMPFPHGMSSDVARFQEETDEEGAARVRQILASKPVTRCGGVDYPAKVVKFREERDVPLPGFDILNLAEKVSRED